MELIISMDTWEQSEQLIEEKVEKERLKWISKGDEYRLLYQKP